MVTMIHRHVVFIEVTQVIAMRLGLILTLLSTSAWSALGQELKTTLTSVQEIRQLSLEAANATIDVRLKGIVTYYDATRRFGFIQDETGGVHFVGLHYIEGSPGFDWPRISAGDHLELQGITARGNFSPFIGIPAASQNALRVLETVPLPEPSRIPVERILNPGHHNQWCELYAILTAVQTTEDRTVLDLNSGGLEYQGILPLTPKETESIEQLVYTELRIRGVYGALFNKRRQMVGLEMFIPSLGAIEPIRTNAGRLFDQRAVSIQELLRFRDPSPERVLIEGVVLLQLPNQGFYIRAGGKGLWVETNIKTHFNPGERVKAVGQAVPGELRPYLSNAIVQTGTKGERPKPRVLTPTQALSPDLDGDLVRVTAKLLDHLDLPNHHLMLLQADNVTFSARCPNQTGKARWPQLLTGSWLDLTGVCAVKAAGTWTPVNPERPNRLSRTPASFTLLLGAPSDISVLHTPGWWTFERLALLAAGITLLAMSALVWVVLLRRRVSQQTLLIAETIERESIQEERVRIARDLHDTLQQNLTGIMHQMNSTAKRLSGTSGHVADSLNLVKRMIQHSLEDVRCTIWNLRTSAMQKADINTGLHDMLEPFLDSKRPIVQFTPCQQPCNLPSVVQHHLVNIVKEAVSNASQHAQANHIDISLDMTAGRLTVTVKDDGIGFDTQSIDALKGHFGLLGMRERVAKIQGEIQIRSHANQGTSITMTLTLPKDANA